MLYGKQLASWVVLGTLGGLPALSSGAEEIAWARGSAHGNIVGQYTDASNWDGGSVPSATDRARVDRGGTVMTIDSRVSAKDFLFGVNEPGQRFEFAPDADVTLTHNYFVAFNRGDITVDIAPNAKLSIGGSMILGQDDNMGHDDEDVTVNVAGDVTMNGGLIFGLRYNGDASDADLLVNISGTVRTDNILIANEEAHGGDKAAFLAPAKNNSVQVKIDSTGKLVLIGDKKNRAEQLIAEGIVGTTDPYASLNVRYDGRDTHVTATASEPE